MTLITDYIEKEKDPIKKNSMIEIYSIIKSVVPEDTTEKISYGMPTFYYKENLVHFNASKNHLGYYPSSSPIVKFSDQLSKYKTSKGAIQFPYNEKLPEKLIQDIVLFRLEEIAENKN
ncbi:iron chaperone [Companilactobacillus metriopterae]|uniref:iron chaperone n=1 Tax=Companilactobacillus metriopterae TaxID=1909267 RepID=UPI00100B1213|nr:DUF1801 domain-containing protein [Companilactobacillus metriopterae]